MADQVRRSHKICRISSQSSRSAAAGGESCQLMSENGNLLRIRRSVVRVHPAVPKKLLILLGIPKRPWSVPPGASRTAPRNQYAINQARFPSCRSEGSPNSARGSSLLSSWPDKELGQWNVQRLAKLQRPKSEVLVLNSVCAGALLFQTEQRSPRRQ